MAQIVRSVAALLEQLKPVLDEESAKKIEEYNQKRFAEIGDGNPKFGSRMKDVKVIIVHETSCQPSRKFALRYRDAGTGKKTDSKGKEVTAHGPQYYIPCDGTVFRFVDLPRAGSASRPYNELSVGAETGHYEKRKKSPREYYEEPKKNDKPDKFYICWQASDEKADIKAQANFLAPTVIDRQLAEKWWLSYPAGAKLYFPKSDTNDGEVLPCWWTEGKDYVGPKRRSRSSDLTYYEMLFTDAQYRSWVVLARYLVGALDIPRNFLLYPHVKRDEEFGSAKEPVEKIGHFRKIVLADEQFDQMITLFSHLNHDYATKSIITEADFDASKQKELHNKYVAYAQMLGKETVNVVWYRMIYAFRGIHGHITGGDGSFSSNAGTGMPQTPSGGLADHDCPGAMFDWHRFAREMWDWWWHPVDFQSEAAYTVAAQRGYRRPHSETPLVEYYFEVDEAAYRDANHLSQGIVGLESSPLIFKSSPSTFKVDKGASVYAMANGELVAARFPKPDASSPTRISMAFVLLKHEIHHKPSFASQTAQGFSPYDFADSKKTGKGGDNVNINEISTPMQGIGYDSAPSIVYSLYMHLERPVNMDFKAMNDANPDWLNRLLFRRTECALGIRFHDTNCKATSKKDVLPWGDKVDDVAKTTALGPLPSAWTADLEAIDKLLKDLEAGSLVTPARLAGNVSIRVILGDFLGDAGFLGNAGSGPTYGVRTEVFSSDLISDAFKEAPDFDRSKGWSEDTDAGFAKTQFYRAYRYKSEWAVTPGEGQKTALKARGVAETDLEEVAWWSEVAASPVVRLLPAAHQLPSDGTVFHYRPHDFMRWINTHTWRSEWPKYKISEDEVKKAYAARDASPSKRTGFVVRDEKGQELTIEGEKKGDTVERVPYPPPPRKRRIA